jgi:hypothetical protein
MLRELGEGRSVVIVPNEPMREHVLHIVRRLNHEDAGGRDVVALAMSRPGDEDRLRGLTCSIVVDHSFWEKASDEVAARVGVILALHRGRQAHA